MTAIYDVFELIDSGYLVRDTSHDHEDGWALKQIEPIRKLSAARSLSTKAGNETRAEVIAECSKAVPTNWTDPLLTGPDSALPKDGAYTNRHIEALLRGIQDRIRALAAKEQ